MENLEQELLQKIKTLNETIWEGRAQEPKVEVWLANFEEDTEGVSSERLHMLYLLSQFAYFGSREIRELLKALYRDLYKYPIVESIRKANNDITDAIFLAEEFEKRLLQTRFLGLGNPSESGHHLLYYFRQENSLPVKLFINSYEIFSRAANVPTLSIKNPRITNYVFIDDFCGSGHQAVEYSNEVLQSLKELDRSVQTAYYALFATCSGLDCIRGNTLFDSVDSIFELDESHKCFGESSRYFSIEERGIDPEFAEEVCLKYGTRLCRSHPLGYSDGQMLIGFHHNTPDNTLPIIWYDEPGGIPWTPIFRRYPKVYGWTVE